MIFALIFAKSVLAPLSEVAVSMHWRLCCLDIRWRGCAVSIAMGMPWLYMSYTGGLELVGL